MTYSRDCKQRTSPRRGAVTILAAFFLVVFMAFAAIVVDCGYLASAKSELQRGADAAALAACWEYAQQSVIHGDTQTTRDLGRQRAQSTAMNNKVCGQAPSLLASDVQWGFLDDITNRNSVLDTATPANFTNAVSVVLRRTTQTNGPIPSFFGKVLGQSGFDVSSTATAAIIRNVRGFRMPTNGSNLKILPIALDEPSWTAMLGGSGEDRYSFNPETGTVSDGSDGILEVNLYPKGTGMPGNRGTVDIGSPNNSTADLARQIVHGVSAQDLSYLGGTLEFNSQGQLLLNGDTGISAGIKDELAQIKGQPRIIPIFVNVQGPGNNAMYTIVKFVGVRVMHVQLTGSMASKAVIVQPAPVVAAGLIPETSGTVRSHYIYSAAMLVK